MSICTYFVTSKETACALYVGYRLVVRRLAMESPFASRFYRHCHVADCEPAARYELERIEHFQKRFIRNLDTVQRKSIDPIRESITSYELSIQRHMGMLNELVSTLSPEARCAYLHTLCQELEHFFQRFGAAVDQECANSEPMR